MNRKNRKPNFHHLKLREALWVSFLNDRSEWIVAASPFVEIFFAAWNGFATVKNFFKKLISSKILIENRYLTELFH